MTHQRRWFSTRLAKQIGRAIGMDFRKVDLEEFRKGLLVELEHGRGRGTNITDGDYVLTGRIAWAHLKEIPDYYTRLLKMERDARQGRRERK
jgi:hypothetical protein